MTYVLSALAYPLMPSTSESVPTQLNAPAMAMPEAPSIDILPGHQIGIPEHLFKKIDKMIEVYKEKFAGNKPTNGPDPGVIYVAPAAWKKEAKGKVPGSTGDTGPKTAEVLAWEEITKAVDELKRLKVKFASYERKAKAEAEAVAAA